MRYAIFVLSAAMTALAYCDPGSFALLFGLLAYSRLCDWVVATRRRGRWRWTAYRVLRSVARRVDPGPWVALRAKGGG